MSVWFFLLLASALPGLARGLFLRKTRYGQLLVFSGLLTLLPLAPYIYGLMDYVWPNHLWLLPLLPVPWLILAIFALFAYRRRGLWFLAGAPVIAFVWLMHLYLALCVPTKSCL
jgi:hypothetical protein